MIIYNSVELQQPTVVLPVLARATTHQLLEDAAKVGQILKSYPVRDFIDRKTGIPQHKRGGFNPQLDYIGYYTLGGIFFEKLINCSPVHVKMINQSL